MSKSEVTAPGSSAPTDRPALGVGWVWPGAGGIGGTINPALTPSWKGYRFAGTEE